VRLQRRGRTVRVAVVNGGADSPRLPRGVTLEVTLPRGAAVMADSPVFWGQNDRPASALRGDRAVFNRPLLRPGRRWEVCQVTGCDGPVQVVVRWQDGDGHLQSRIGKSLEQSAGIRRGEAHSGERR
jgi:hypothetical protein